MEFVDLKRGFVPIEKDQDSKIELFRIWEHRIPGLLDWPDLLKHQRVVLLAEASSGKTEEFRHQALALSAIGKAAFFVRIEDLADDGFKAALQPNTIIEFEIWAKRAPNDDAWFFLDSVDEARLNRKSLDRALRRFAGELDRGLEKAHVFLSCRVSDWKGGEDRETVERLLPVWEKPTSPKSENDDAALLDPIFNNRQKTFQDDFKDPERKLNSLLVVQLSPLTYEQRRILAAEAGVQKAETFVQQIEREGLETLAERPADLLDLAEYWKSKGRFGSLAEMTEHSLVNKLRECDKYRADNRDLSPEKARRGAEQLAAALTLTKCFTLKAPGQAPDPLLAAGALNPSSLLEQWTDAECNALLRRAIFAPSTYGRIRFYHRSCQEYLMASWLSRLLREGCPLVAIWELIFAERYGIATIAPSLQPIAAWLALDRPDIRDEIIKREPLVLLLYGDPRSLPLNVKERLLLTYADRHITGEISDKRIEDRALWLFAEPDLAETIQKSWAINKRDDFRTDLLRLISEGRIEACADLARDIVLDETVDNYMRITALEALAACGDTKGLTFAAQWLKTASNTASARLNSGFAQLLFPLNLSVDELMDLIERSPLPRADTIEGFAYSIKKFWNACASAGDREQFIARIADLCLSPPFVDSFKRISMRHHEIANHLFPVAHKELVRLGGREGTEALIRLLMAVERAHWYGSNNQEAITLNALVSENVRLKRRLFWADVEEVRQNTERGNKGKLTLHWQVSFGFGKPLWEICADDLVWLFEDLSERPLEADKRIALSAILEILQKDGKINAEMSRLRSLVIGSETLKKDLDAYIAPRSEDEEERQLRIKGQQYKRDQEEKKQREKASWIKFRKEIEKDPSKLSDPTCIADWTTGAFRLYNLNHWLSKRIKDSLENAALQWRLLEEGFGRAVAEKFRDGMKALWRVTQPERPKHTKNGQSSVKYTTIMSFAGLGIESADDPDWASQLSIVEVERAAHHACLSERGYPDWIEDLVKTHPVTVLPIFRSVLQEEWSGSGHRGIRTDFFSHYGGTDKPIHTAVQLILFEIIGGKKPKNLDMLAYGLRCLRRLNLDQQQRRRMAAVALRRLRSSKNPDEFHYYLSMLFIIDPDQATVEFRHRMEREAQESRGAWVMDCLGALFARHSALAAGTLSGASVSSLKDLVCIAYQFIRPEEDIMHKGSYNDARDIAQNVRADIVKTLIDRPGADAFRAMKDLIANGVFKSQAIRFNEAAHGKAEMDTEQPAWSPAEVIAFETHHTAPAKTGEALLGVVKNVLSDIKSNFDGADATSRALLERAKTEEEVQHWLAEQMRFHSQSRFHVHREPQVAHRDKPDIVIASTAAPVEVAIEVKHGKMGWSVRDLERALNSQLAEDYLKPMQRRHGVLVITYHGKRKWRNPKTRAIITFSDLINHLQDLAKRVVRNKFGAVEVSVFGINTSP